MIAILTKYLGPTDTKPARIVASTCNGHRLVRSKDTRATDEFAHRIVADALCKREHWKWKSSLIAGAIKGGYAFVFTT